MALFRELLGASSAALSPAQCAKAPRPRRGALASAQSPALSEVVRDINKYSNNVMARQLFLTLGAEGAGAPASVEKTARVITPVAVGAKDCRSPSWYWKTVPASRASSASARRASATCCSPRTSSPVMPELMASLPLVAVDGTMRKRLSGAEVAGHAHIKTGTLSGARAIAGYVLDARGRRVVTVLIINHANAGNAQPVQDALLRWVHGRGADGCCQRPR